MASKRIARLNEQLKREIAELARTSVRDPRVGLVSITGVQVSTDLSHAKVFIRALGGEAERAESLAGLIAAAPFLRRALGQILHIRKIPELHFQEDRSLEQAQRIEEILAEVLPPGHDSGTAADSEGEEEQDGEDTEAGG